ncbi:hypothetical protein D6D13_10163 [Aureobasidium pullulans]|uniref:Protein PNS1 n=1 Tax=Aureobasidium pullulans TaxID=5580 RepID=A0A4S9BZB7_AURPU|nr:hypothetical protein D6D13_10163 [Aureobasidium pullulans]
MFSEYASRFLAQSQSRLSFTQHEPDPRSRNPLDRRRPPASSSRYVQRTSMPTPYQPSGSYLSRFPFASRTRHDVEMPLFSANEGFDQEDEETQHEREMTDYLALQKSRRNFIPSHLNESSEIEDHNIESSNLASRANLSNSRHKSAMVDVELGSTDNDDGYSDFDSIDRELDARPPAFQMFQPSVPPPQSTFLPQETDPETAFAYPRPPSPDGESVPPTVILPAPEPPQHDMFWAQLYKICIFAMFATFILVWFHTSTPNSKRPLGDTIYSALTSSINLLLWDTVITVIVAMLWLALLREYVRVLVFLMLVSVPIILFSFSLYPFIASYKGAWHGASVQDKVMRWFSFVPAVIACVWVYSVYKGRRSLGKAIGILEFACRIVSASQTLTLLGFGTLGVVVCFTWIWMGMFTRLFLGGHMSKLQTFIIDLNTWWLGFYFVMIYLWTLGVIAGVQRATTAATVSQWYFHRLSVPAPSSTTVVRASFMHATGPMLGTICLSTFLSLLIRLPLIILPRRIASLVTLCAFSMVPTSLAALTNPLTLTYAAIHSQSLSISARGLSQLHFVSDTSPTTTLNPSVFAAHPGSGGTMMPYRLAKLLLHATRFIMSFALGFGGWVSTARNVQLAGGGFKGSLYAYIVGLIAATIGWAILGAIEGVIGGVVDASVVCWASETGGRGGAGEARYCREAGELFGEGDY